MYNIISILHPWQKLLLGSMLAMLFCLVGLVGSYDIESEEQEAKLYCENVKAKVWPDYGESVICD